MQVASSAVHVVEESASGFSTAPAPRPGGGLGRRDKPMAVIRVHTSNSLGDLVAALAESLPPPGPGPGLDALFEGPWLVVPGRPVETFVDLELARRRNISGGLITLTLRGAIARLCMTAAPDIVLVERAHLVGELLAVLQQQDEQPDAQEPESDHAHRGRERDEAASSVPALQPLKRYVRAAGDAFRARERRRLQLAGELAQLFDEWSQTRPELLAAWRTGKPVSAEGESAPLEAAERALWRLLFAPGGRFARRGAIEGRRFLTVDGVPSALLRLEEEGALDGWRLPSQVHLFGIPEIPRAYFPLLEWLGQRTAVHVYALNPCREFWEDLDTAKAARWRATHPRSPELTPRHRAAGPQAGGRAGGRAGRRGVDNRQLELGGFGQPPGGDDSVLEPFSQGNDNPLLTLWGRAARDNLRLLGQLTDGDFEPRFIDRIRPAPGPGADRPSLLARLQQDLLEGKVAHAPTPAAAADASIRILGAPDPRREWESIAAEIWALMRADATLRFGDIAVRVAGSNGASDAAFSLASAVFQEASVPCTWVDPTLATASHLGEAFLQAMELFDGSFTRREVLDVITHPNIRGRFADALADASSAGSADVWVELCEALGVAQGADRAAFAGTYVNADVFNWDQAIRRLALGVLASGPRSGFETPLTGSASFGSASPPQPQARLDSPADSVLDLSYVPAEVPAALRDAADSLGLLLRSLIGDADFARQARMTLTEWVDFGRAVIDCYTCALSAADEDARARILAALDELGARVGVAVRLPLHVAVTLMRDTLSSLRVGSGQLLGAGVVVGSLRALRSLPFRVVFVAGLGGNEFPATEWRSVFDPLAGPPRTAFPVGPTARERDQDLFLDAVMAAGETLVLTCVDRNPFTAEPRLPSSVVVQLTDVLRQHYLVPEGAGAEDSSSSARAFMRSAPLHRDEDSAVRAAFPAAMAEAVARDVGATIRLQVPQAARLPGDALTRALSVQTRATLAPLLSTLHSMGAPAVALGPARPPPIVIRLAELVRFLECPLQGSARFLLRLRDVQDDAEARDLENEPLESPRGLEMRLCTEAFLAAFARQHPPSAGAFEAAYDELAARQRFSAAAPTGRFREHARTRDLARMNRWWEQLCVPALGVVGPPARICFGRPELLKPATEWRPAIRLTLPSRTVGAGARPTETVVELHGTTSAMVRLESSRGGLLLFNRGKFSDLPYSRHRVLGFIDTLAYIAAGGSGALATGEAASPWTTTTLQNLHLWGEGKTPRQEPALAEAIGREAALSCLTTLADELLAGVSTLLFPCEAVFSAEKSELSIAEQIAFMRGDVFYRPRLSTGWGPVPDPFEYPIPEDAAARELRRRRFGLLLGPERILAVSAGQSRGDAPGENR